VDHGCGMSNQALNSSQAYCQQAHLRSSNDLVGGVIPSLHLEL